MAPTTPTATSQEIQAILDTSPLNLRSLRYNHQKIVPAYIIRGRSCEAQTRSTWTIIRSTITRASELEFILPAAINFFILNSHRRVELSGSLRHDLETLKEDKLRPAMNSSESDTNQQSNKNTARTISARISKVFSNSRAALSGRSAGWWAARVVLVVVVVALVWFVYTVYITLNPDSGPEGYKIRRIASTATKYLSNSPDVISAEITEASADNGGPSAYLDVRLKDDTNPDAVANLLASTRDATFGKDNSDTHINLTITLTWTLHDTSVSILASGSRPPDRSIVRRDLATAGEATTIENTHIDYGQVTALPTTFLQPSAPRSTKTFTMNRWHVTSTSNADGQFPTTVSFEQVIAAAAQASPTGTISLDGDTLSVTGLATDENKGLTPEAAAPIVHAVTDCQAAGLTTLQLNDEAKKEPSSDDYWLTFTCNNGTWTPHDGGNTGQDEATILNKATEL